MGEAIGLDHQVERLTHTLGVAVVVVVAEVGAALVGGKPMVNALPGGTDETGYGSDSRFDACT